MSSRGKKGVAFVLGSLFIFLFGICLWQFSMLESCYGGMTQIRMGDRPVTTQVVEHLVREKWENAKKEGLAARDVPLYTAWTQRGGVLLRNADLNRSTSQDVIYYCGDNSPRFDLVQMNGCAISEETAFALWGTKDVIGSEVRIGDQDFVVEKILPSGRWSEKWAGSAIVAKWNGKLTDEASEEMEFDVMDIGGGPVSVSAAQVIAAGNLKSTAVIDYDNLLEMLNALRRLPAWGIAVMWAFHLVRKAQCNSRKFKNIAALWEGKSTWSEESTKQLAGEWGKAAMKVALPVAAGVGVLGVTAIVFGLPFVISDSFLPTRWSDFSFWSNAASASGEMLRTLMTMRLYEPDAYFKDFFTQIALGGAVQTVVLLFCYRMVAGVLNRKLHTVWEDAERKIGGNNGIHRIKGYCEKIWYRCNGSGSF